MQPYNLANSSNPQDSSDRLQKLDELEAQLKIELIEMSSFARPSQSANQSNFNAQDLDVYSNGSSVDRIIQVPKKKKIKLLDFRKKQTFGSVNDFAVGKLSSQKKQKIDCVSGNQANFGEINPFDSTLETLISHVNGKNKQQMLKFAASTQNSPLIQYPNFKLPKDKIKKQQILKDLQLLCHLTESNMKHPNNHTKEIFQEIYNNSKMAETKSSKKQGPNALNMLEKSEFLEKQSSFIEQVKKYQGLKIADLFKDFRNKKRQSLSMSSWNKFNSQIQTSPIIKRNNQTLMKISDIKTLTNQITQEIDGFLAERLKSEMGDRAVINKLDTEQNLKKLIRSNASIDQEEKHFLEQLCDLKNRFSQLGENIQRGTASTDEIINEVQSYRKFRKNLSQNNNTENSDAIEFDSLMGLACEQFGGKKIQAIPSSKTRQSKFSLNEISKKFDTKNNSPPSDKNVCSLNSLSRKKPKNSNFFKTSIHPSTLKNSKATDTIDKGVAKEIKNVLIPVWDKCTFFYHTFYHEIIFVKNNYILLDNKEGIHYFTEHRFLNPLMHDDEEGNFKEALRQRNITVVCPLIKLNKIMKKYGTKERHKIFKSKEVSGLEDIKWDRFEVLSNR